MQKPQSLNLVWHHATVTRTRRERLERPPRRRDLVHRPSQLGEIYDRARGGRPSPPDVVPHVRARRRQHTPRAERRPRVFARGPAREHPPQWQSCSRKRAWSCSPLSSRHFAATASGLLLHGDFLEVYCRGPLEVCKARDPKGHYPRARAGDIKDFTGISAPYEDPRDPELILDTARYSIAESVDCVCAMLTGRGVIARRTWLRSWFDELTTNGYPFFLSGTKVESKDEWQRLR